MIELHPWTVAGSYYEVCNCEAICPCRRSGGARGGRPSYENCDFALSWWIKQGRAGAVDLGDLKVVMAGRWEATPEDPWHVILYIDERATAAQKDALTEIFLGRAGGHVAKSSGTNIVEVPAVKSAHIEPDPPPGRRGTAGPPSLPGGTRGAVPHVFTVSCGIPGNEHP